MKTEVNCGRHAIRYRTPADQVPRRLTSSSTITGFDGRTVPMATGLTS
ncbi:MAG: hypothetical protein QM778_06620 [Myxococcales bacterium]